MSADEPEVAGSMEGVPQELVARTKALESQLALLLRSLTIRFDDGCRRAIPEGHGVHRIFDPAQPGDTVRAGRTKTAAGGLRQRVYQNHLMGNQTGNLRAQRVGGGECADPDAAKRHVRANLVVQVLVVEAPEDRRWLEHFMLGILKARYCD